MRLGIIARADQGGLAQLTCEMVRALRPENVLLMDLVDGGRGPTDPGRLQPYCTRLWVARNAWANTYGFPADCDDFFHHSDVIYSAETFYDRRAYAIAAGNGKATVLHVMPELLSNPQVRSASHVWIPTPWRAEQVAVARGHDRTPPEVVPVPVPTDRFESRFRRRQKAEVFFAHGGEAFHDRNGLGIVYQALQYVDETILLYVRGGVRPDHDRKTCGKVTVQWLPPTDDYVDVIPEETDVMLMPRRYGGLSMPYGEAAAQGIPTVMSNLDPQREWLGEAVGGDGFLIPMLGADVVEMKGGPVEVWDTHPAYLADIIDTLASADPHVDHRVERASMGAYIWAQRHSWDQWTDRYMRLLEAAAG